MQGELETLEYLAADIADRLVCRPLDQAKAVEEQIAHYKEKILNPLEVFLYVVLIGIVTLSLHVELH